MKTPEAALLRQRHGVLAPRHPLGRPTARAPRSAARSSRPGLPRNPQSFVCTAGCPRASAFRDRKGKEVDVIVGSDANCSQSRPSRGTTVADDSLDGPRLGAVVAAAVPRRRTYWVRRVRRKRSLRTARRVRSFRGVGARCADGGSHHRRHHLRPNLGERRPSRRQSVADVVRHRAAAGAGRVGESARRRMASTACPANSGGAGWECETLSQRADSPRLPAATVARDVAARSGAAS